MKGYGYPGDTKITTSIDPAFGNLEVIGMVQSILATKTPSVFNVGEGGSIMWGRPLEIKEPSQL